MRFDAEVTGSLRPYRNVIGQMDESNFQLVRSGLNCCGKKRRNLPGFGKERFEKLIEVIKY